MEATGILVWRLLILVSCLKVCYYVHKGLWRKRKKLRFEE
jgi:hypothetical protein